MTRLLLALVLVLLVTGPAWRSPVARPGAAGNVRAETGTNPVIDLGGCTYVPDASHPEVFPCSSTGQTSRYAFVGAPVELDLNVSSPSGSAFTVTIWWDAYLRHDVFPFRPGLGNASAVQSFDVTPTGAGVPVHLSTNWTFDSLSNNTIIDGKSSYYTVYVNVTSSTGYDAFSLNGCSLLPYGDCFMKIAVAFNTPPVLTGVQAVYTRLLLPPNPIIPVLSFEASVQDLDNDPVVVTWVWDDGNVTVNRTEPAASWQWVNVSHQYEFPLNVSPRNVYYHLNVSVDDGIPTHIVPFDVLIYFYIGFDGMPKNLTFISPDLGSMWLVNTSVPIETHLEEPEGEPILYYWDFGDGNASPQGVLGANGSVSTTHTYAEPGEYNLTIWATDGVDKELCLNLTANCSTTRSHWASSTLLVGVYLNRPPIIDLTIASNPGITMKPAVFAVALRDLDADNLTVTWDFGDGTARVVNLTAGSNFTESATQAHVYTQVNATSYTYVVRVWVDDRHGHNVTNETSIFIGSANMPPLVSATLLLTNNTVRANDTFSLRVNVSDPEGDAVWITVDWGDGTFANETNASMVPNVNYTVVLTHSYWTVGNYTINITATDRMIYVTRNATGALVFLPHNATVLAIVAVEAAAPPPESTEWTWVDYTTLALVLAVPIGASIRWGYNRRQERKED